MKSLELEFARLLRAHRAKAGITQLGLALKLGYGSPSTISRWEGGELLPSRDTVLGIAEVFRLTREEAGALLRSANYLPPTNREREALNLPRSVPSQEEELTRSIQRLTDQLMRAETAPRYSTDATELRGIRYGMSRRVGDVAQPSVASGTSAPAKPLEGPAVLTGLTPRQHEIVNFLVSEKGADITDEESAKELFITRNTLRRHMRTIFKKLKVRSKAGLVYLVLSKAGPHDSSPKGV